jgi:hypothetical protein
MLAGNGQQARCNMRAASAHRRRCGIP